MEDYKENLSGLCRKRSKESFSVLIGPSKTAKKQTTYNNKKKSSSSNFFNLPRIMFVFFHPCSVALFLMISLLALKIHQIISNTGGQRNTILTKLNTLRKIDKQFSNSAPRSIKEFVPSTTISKPYSMIHSQRKKRQVSTSEEAHNELMARSNELNSPEELDFKPKKRIAALTYLDDMLLDGEIPLPLTDCLDINLVTRLEDDEKKYLETRPHLSEINETCKSNEDCLTLSPFMWQTEGTGEPCRKRTYLRCNVTEQKCQCQDHFDLRWDTGSAKTTYQWNPITKTCYVRGTNPCKQEIPCAPGTTCRTTVSISYNTPPIQRICECTDIELAIFAGNRDWWYCKRYWQRTWFFDLDNIKMWEPTPAHIYSRLSEETINGTEQNSTAGRDLPVLGADPDATNLHGRNLEDQTMQAPIMEDLNMQAPVMENLNMRAAKTQDPNMKAANIQDPNEKAESIQDPIKQDANIQDPNMQAENMQYPSDEIPIQESL